MTDLTHDAAVPDEDRMAYAAWSYAATDEGRRLGWRVLPVYWMLENGLCACRATPWMPPCPASPGKHPVYSDWTTFATNDGEQIARWWAEHPEANIGVATGAGSGIWVLDVDEGVRSNGTFKEGLDSLTRLVMDHGDLPETFTTRTGGGGSQYFFLLPDGIEVRNSTSALGPDFPDIDTRGEGGQVVVPPSVSGKGPYTLETDIPPVHAPQWLVQLLLDAGTAVPVERRSSVQQAPSEQLPEADRAPAVALSQGTPPPTWLASSIASKLQAVRDAPDGQGNDTINRMAYMIGQYVPNGWITYEDAHAWLMDAVRSWAHPHPSADYTITRALNQGQQHPYADLSAVATSGDLSDAVMADRVCSELLSGLYCWSAGMEWLRWTGQVWEPSTDVEVTEAVRLYVLAEVRATLPTVAGNNQARRAVTDLMSRGKINNMVQLARGPLLVDARRFDSYADLLNTPSGVVDLRDGSMRSHDPGLYFTKITKADYVPDATHPDWDGPAGALQALPPCCQDWFRIRIGQGITGHMTPDDTLLLMQGAGENGKTTVLASIMNAVGAESFAVDVPKNVLVGKSDDPHALMPFRGARLAVIEELPEGRRLSATRIKETVGTPHMSGRFMYKNLITWKATHSLFLTTNYIPSVAETDHGTWRRLLMLRFPYRFVKPGVPLTRPNDRRGDPHLRVRLMTGRDQATAVLAWAVRGAIEWYRAGQIMPSVPAEVAADTEQWRTESDLILAYWRDRLEADPQGWIMSDDLFSDFRYWLGAKGHPNAWSNNLISQRFEAHDETAAAHLIKVYPVVDDRVSRPGCNGPEGHEGKQRKGWAGVRFKTL